MSIVVPKASIAAAPASALLLGASDDPERRDLPALIHADGVISHGELAARVHRRARELGTGRRLVMIAGANEAEVVISHLAALTGGHVSWLIPDAAHADGLAARFAPDTRVRPADGGVAIDVRSERPLHALHPDLAAVASTSGSTGAPRLVRLSHANVVANAAAIATYLRLGTDERAITTLPLHYCYGLSVLHSHLFAGGSVVLNDRSVSDPAFWEALRAQQATSFAGVPHTFALAERAGFADFALPSLRYVTQAGGRMEPQTVRRLAAFGAQRGWKFVVMYGQTEATARMAYLPSHLAERFPQCIGIPIPGGEFTLRPVPEHPDRSVGELIYRGPNVMMGYADTPRDLANGSETPELATGDLAVRNADGLYEIVGRRSRFLKIFGLRIDLAQVEALLADDGIDALSAGDDERLAVAVTGTADPRAVATWLAERLALPLNRICVAHHAVLPRLENGKPDYRAVAAQIDQANSPNPGVATRAAGRWFRRSPAAGGRSVAALYASALGASHVTADDTFAGLRRPRRAHRIDPPGLGDPPGW